jgi:hypothetical protein
MPGRRASAGACTGNPESFWDPPLESEISGAIRDPPDAGRSARADCGEQRSNQPPHRNGVRYDYSCLYPAWPRHWTSWPRSDDCDRPHRVGRRVGPARIGGDVPCLGYSVRDRDPNRAAIPRLDLSRGHGHGRANRRVLVGLRRHLRRQFSRSRCCCREIGRSPEPRSTRLTTLAGRRKIRASTEAAAPVHSQPRSGTAPGRVAIRRPDRQRVRPPNAGRTRRTGHAAPSGDPDRCHRAGRQPRVRRSTYARMRY